MFWSLMSDSKLSCQRFVVYDHLMFFFCLSVLSAHYWGNNFVYGNWIFCCIVSLSHKNVDFFFNKVSLEVKVLLLTHSKTKAEVQTQISNCWLHFSFRYKYASYFFLLFQKYFSFRNSSLAFKNYSWCRSSFSSKDLSALRVRK